MGITGMMARLYSIYGFLVFLLVSAFFLPAQLLLSLLGSKGHHLALRLNRPWARSFFLLLFIPVRIEKKYDPSRDQQFILCANHFSYLDIPALGILPLSFKFIGKMSVSRIPMFGTMFKRIHIPVDRSKVRSRAESLKKAKDELNLGFNLGFYPEGGVLSQNPPEMVPFRYGAFNLAVEFQLPILPITLGSNYRILPDDNKFLLYHHPLDIIIHPPVYPQGKDEKEVKRLKDEVFRIIQESLHEKRS
jgi:1-acyl-sn-glycerol-3-phosphate acyltransferase